MGDRECYNCHRSGHMARECPDGDSRGGGGISRGGGGGGGGFSRDGGAGGTKCYNCNETGHFARECPTKDSGSSRDGGGRRGGGGGGGGGGGMECYNCGSVDTSRESATKSESQERVAAVVGVAWSATTAGSVDTSPESATKSEKPREGGGGRGGGRGGGDIECYNCGETGHISRECPSQRSSGGGGRGGGRGGSSSGGGGSKLKFEDKEEEVTSQDDSRLVSDAEVAEEESSEPVRKKFKTKFNWADVILEVVQSKGTEMKLKRLKKKVLSEYLAQGCTEKSEEKLCAKFDKRLKRHPNIKVLGDKVNLINMDH